MLDKYTYGPQLHLSITLSALLTSGLVQEVVEWPILRKIIRKHIKVISMGTIASLRLGPLEVAWSKNEHLLSHADLFQAADLKSCPIEDTEDSRPEEWYEQSLRLIKDRLELMGYTLERARTEFENTSPFADEDPLPLSFDEVFEVLKTVDVDKVTNEFSEDIRPGEFAPAHIQDLIRSKRHLHFEFHHWDLEALLENFSPYSALRILAESPHNIDLPVVWEFDGVVRNGWVERERITHGPPSTSKFLVVTEGSSDAKILRKALDLLRPHIADFFYFVDMHEGYPFTGTGNLYNFVKGLVSIRIQNDVIVVFDNDVEGIFALNRCRALNVPDNMCIMRLPDIPEFKQFYTVGPNGEQLADINGRGASIECYLDLGKNPCVRWTNYLDSHDAYQGSLIAKDRYKMRFLDQDTLDPTYNYGKLVSVLDSLVSDCTIMRSRPYSKAVSSTRIVVEGF